MTLGKNMTESALYIVATPIGNLKDISKRAIEVLSTVDKIAAEDTRHSKKLLSFFNITTPCMSFHEYNENAKVNKLINFIKNGKSLALISDAGTPLISDPGYNIVSKAKEAGIKVIPIPGSCALIAALCASGLPANKFIFMGFLPVKQSAKNDFLSNLKTMDMTMIFYEAPHRLLATIQSMKDIFGSSRQIVIAREITKVHETIMKDNIGNILDIITNDSMQQKGEIVIILEGYQKPKEQNITEENDHIIKILLDSMPMKQAVSIAVKITGLNKNLIYKHALEIKNQNNL